MNALDTKNKPDHQTLMLLEKRLIEINSKNRPFVSAIISYAQMKQSRCDMISSFLDDHPEATASRIMMFIFDQKDFFEDLVNNI